MHFTLDVQPWALASYPHNLLQLALSSIYFFPPAETSEQAFPFPIAFSFFAAASLSL